jgi:hypothetical protein
MIEKFSEACIVCCRPIGLCEHSRSDFTRPFHIPPPSPAPSSNSLVENHRGTLYTYSGRISFPGGSPSIMDMAISLSREGRYVGAGMRFWTVALHTFVVCDLLPDNLKLHGLLHDSPETVTGDIPKPAKTDEIEALEIELLKGVYNTFKLTLPTAEEHRLIKVADTMTKHGEVYTVGTQSLQEVYPRCPEAEVLIHQYVDMYDYADMLDAGGRVPIEFMCRYREYRDLLERKLPRC